MRSGVLCALHAPGEAELVAALDAPGTGVLVVRRCADLAEVTALAIAGVGRVVVLGSGLPGVDRAALARLRAAGSRVVLLAQAHDLARCSALGAEAVLEIEAPVEAVVRATQAAAREAERQPPSLAGDERQSAAGPAQPSAAPSPDVTRQAQRRPGRLLAVWGPHGSPGRTTIAVNLAAELAALGEQALLVDADTWGGCVGQTLGLLDESPGLAAAARSAANGTLDAPELSRLCPVVEPGLRVLTGLTRPDRWRELAPTGLDMVWETARTVADWGVVDCGFSLEDDGGAGFEAMLGPRRNGATLSALAAADVVLVVGAAEPVGIQRLVQGLTDLGDLGIPVARRLVVVNRVRASAAGPRPEQAVSEALVRYAGVPDPVLVPDDRVAVDRAMLEGVTLRATAPSSPARLAIARLAATLAEPPAVPGTAATGTAATGTAATGTAATGTAATGTAATSGRWRRKARG
jgi:MinD-like ATPase involved in chromosome partitioning or flagellar assembly/DNA-binding NarL/FixJ family response regulator